MSESSTPNPSFSPKRRFAIAISVLISCLAVVCIVGMANYLGVRHFKRFHISRDYPLELSPLSRQVASSLTNTVQVKVYFDREENATTDTIYKYVTALLKEYRSYTTNILVEVVDYLKDPSEAALLKEKYGLSDQQKNLVIFDNNGKVDIVRQPELSAYAAAGYEGGTNLVFKRTDFKGEQMFTSALLSVSENSQPRACFVQGHGEHDPGEVVPDGYSQMALLLRQNNIEVGKILLSGTNGIPSECNLLIVAGPQVAYQEEELNKIQTYLENGGRMLVLLRPFKQSGLASLLSNWNVKIGGADCIVGDRWNSYNKGFAIGITNLAAHPVTQPLIGSQIVMNMPRWVAPLPTKESEADAPDVQTLALTSKGGWEGRYVFSERRIVSVPNGLSGQISLGVAVEKGAVPGVSANHGATRLIVAGESGFLNNASIGNLANRDFANLAVNWLLDRNTLVNIGPQPVKRYRLNMTDSRKRQALWILMAGFPGAVLAFGILVWLIRRV